MTPEIEEKLKELLDFAKAHELTEVCWQEGQQKISFRRGLESTSDAELPAPVESVETVAVEEELVVRAPMVGTFRRAGSKDHPPFVMEGNHIKPGDRVAIVECMRIPNDVTSFCEGVIKKVMVNDGQAVEYGQPLFLVSPAENGHTNGKS